MLPEPTRRPTAEFRLQSALLETAGRFVVVGEVRVRCPIVIGVMEQVPFPRFILVSEGDAMLVERGLRVMNVEAVGDAYAIASNYLRKSGAMPDSQLTNDRLLEIIVRMFHRGESNKLRLANIAIAQFQAVGPAF
jgi:hypothetical protein